jgi:hypothetical protein
LPSAQSSCCVEVREVLPDAKSTEVALDHNHSIPDHLRDTRGRRVSRRGRAAPTATARPAALRTATSTRRSEAAVSRRRWRRWNRRSGDVEALALATVGGTHCLPTRVTWRWGRWRLLLHAAGHVPPPRRPAGVCRRHASPSTIRGWRWRWLVRSWRPRQLLLRAGTAAARSPDILLCCLDGRRRWRRRRVRCSVD